VRGSRALPTFATIANKGGQTLPLQTIKKSQ